MNDSATEPTYAERLARVDCPAFAHRRAQRAVTQGQGPPPIVLKRGDGLFLEDVDGNRYLDMIGGFGSLLLGHGHEGLQKIITTQASTLTQGLGDVYASDVKIHLMERLAELTAKQLKWEQPQVLITQAGADAVTAAIKTASLFTGRSRLVAFDGAYHGLGYAPLALCGFQKSFREPFAQQLSSHVDFAPYPGVRGATVTQALARTEELLRSGDTAAVIVEPILGRGGCVIPPGNFLPKLSTLAHRYGALVIADEIWTGLGRTGRWFRSEGASPDILCLGKGLGGGLSISACIAPARIMGAWARGGQVVHTSTHAGNPLACAGALFTLDAIESMNLLDHAIQTGERLRCMIEQRCQSERIVEVRGDGLLTGVEMAQPADAQKLMGTMREQGVLVLTGGLQGQTLTLTPPLIFDDEGIDFFTAVLSQCLDSLSDHAR